MQANPLWPVETRFPTLDRDIRRDVVVVGGGMAGLSAAYRLLMAGYDVSVIERGEVGGPATGASSGVLYYGSGTNLIQAISLFGEEDARLLWTETAAVIDEILTAAEGGEIDCGRRECGSIMVAKTEAEARDLESEYSAVKKLGLPVRLLSSSETRDHYPAREFVSGLAFDGVGQIHPARFGAGLAKNSGLEIYENTSMLGWKVENGGVSVQTPKGKVKAARAVIATNTEPVFGLENYFDFESSVILASKPTKRIFDVFPAEKIVWSMEEKYDIVYPRGDCLILELYALGDEEEKLKYYFPGVEFELLEQWGESWAKPRDWFPMVGEVAPNVFSAVAMGDQGIIMSWLSGKKIRGIIERKEDWFSRMADPTRFSRKKEMKVQ